MLLTVTVVLIYIFPFTRSAVCWCVTCNISWAESQPNHFLKNVVGNTVESADKRVESVLQDADLCHIMAAVLAGRGCTVAAVYTIALFDQNP